MYKNLQAVVFLTVFSIVSTHQAYAQPVFAPPGAEWYFGFKDPGLIPSSGYTHYQYSGDTIILSQQAKIIKGTTYYYDYNDPTILVGTMEMPPVILRQSGDSILTWLYGQYRLLWRTGLQAGQTFLTGGITMQVDSANTVVLNGQTLRRTYLHGTSPNLGPSGNALIYDDYGPDDGFYYYSCWGSYDCYEPSFCRYKSPQTGLIQFNGFHCEVLTAVSQPAETWNVALSPNPCSDFLTVDLTNDIHSGCIAEVFDQVGRLVKSVSLNPFTRNFIQTGDLAEGIYFCRLVSLNGERQVSRFEKM
jgi:hypothetical protein